MVNLSNSLNLFGPLLKMLTIASVGYVAYNPKRLYASR
jgi:hypothetical protein